MAAAGLVGALALTACDSGGGSDSPAGAHSGSGAGSGSGPDSSTAPGATGSASASGGAGSGGSAKDAALSGSWLATTGGKEVVLIVNGGKAALFSTDRTTCAGSTAEEGGKHVLRLSACKTRTTGTVDSVNKTTLRVTWEGGLGTETYTRAEGGTIPSGLPTASLGS
ncbi:hypothetical protein GTY23_25140 [Streptomyces sp. SID5998]|nr:hypothetical protein [Streptomyces sp. SID5998]